MNTNHTAAATLYQTSVAAWAKARKNEGKLQFMSLTPAGIHAYSNEGWVSQIAEQFAAAEQASKDFAAAVAGMSAEEIVSIIGEVA